MSTYSPILRTELIGDGQQPGAWGATTNSNFQYIFEAAIAGYVAVTVSPSSNNQVLTYTNGPSSNASLDQTVYAILKLNTGTVTANFNIFAPPVSKTYTVWNNTSYSATFYNSTVIGNTTAAGSGVIVPAGAKAKIWSDGTNFYGVDSTTGNLTIAGNLSVSGTTTLTGVATFAAAPVMSALTASSAVATDASKNLVSVANTGTGSNVLAISPALTGTPTAPTASAGTSTTQIATTAFVQNVAGGLGTMSTQNANSVNITGGSITGITDLAVADGGTGASSITANSVVLGNGTSALSGNLVAPGAAGRVLVSNGTTWTSNTLAASGVKLGLGITGEIWYDVTGSRNSGQTYTNSNAYPIMVVVASGAQFQSHSVVIVVGGVQVSNSGGGGNFYGGGQDASCIVPAGATYSVSFNNCGIQSWAELY